MGPSLGALLHPEPRLMAQVLKEEVRARIVESALAAFAEEGYAGATLAAIGRRAGVGAASVYRYYSSKRRLLDAAVPRSLVRELESLLERRVHALAAGKGSEGAGGDEMLRLWTEHRLAMVILLDRSEGTPYAGFGRRFVDTLVELTLAEIRASRPAVRLSEPTRFVLREIFENTRRMLAAILSAHEDPRAIREAVERFWSYQIAGLQAFAASAA